MATAKKTSTKKTTKKPARATKTTRATVSKKTTAKKPASKAKVVATTAVKVTSPLERLRSINLLSAIVYVAFAVLTAIFVSNTSGQAVLTHEVRDSFAASSQEVVLAPATEVLATVQYRYILIVLLALGAVGSLLLATKLRKSYEAGVTYGAAGWRWLLMGLTAGLTLVLVSFMAGITDVMTLKTILGLVIATTLLGWIADRENAGVKQSHWLAYGASIFTGVVAWLPLLGSLVGTTLYGEERFGWHVYALAAAVLAGFIGFAINQYLHIKKHNLEYSFVEQRYLRIDQLTKFAVVLIIFSALAK